MASAFFDWESLDHHLDAARHGIFTQAYLETIQTHALHRPAYSLHSRPHLSHELLHVLHELLRLLHRRKMPPTLMPTIPHQIPRLLHPRFGDRGQFLRVPGVTQRLLDVPLRVRVKEGGFGAEELAVGKDGAREGLGEPVEGDGVEDLVERRRFVGPLDELLSDPTKCRSVSVDIDLCRRAGGRLHITMPVWQWGLKREPSLSLPVSCRVRLHTSCRGSRSPLRVGGLSDLLETASLPALLRTCPRRCKGSLEWSMSACTTLVRRCSGVG